MFFANLGLGPFLALAGAVSAISVALYLLDRSRRRVIVSTLRFWTAANQPAAVQRRKQIQQPLSLLLQLLAMILLLLAIAQLRLGSEAKQSKRHVLILETSAWMSSRAEGQQLIDIARTRARAYLSAIPANDPVMLLRADALATPATPFETDRGKLEAAIAQSVPSATALNLNQALAVARMAQAGAGIRGEIVFVGSGRINESDTAPDVSGNLRILPVGGTQENLGLRKIGVRRSATAPDTWDILVTVRNYGTREREAVLSAAVANSPAGAQRLLLPAGAEREASFTYRTRAAGILAVRLLPNDAFPNDNRAQVELPADQPLSVTVYSDQPEALKPILAANREISAVYKPTSQYAPATGGLVLLDRFQPAQRPTSPSIWIDPPSSPIPIRSKVQNPPQLRWLTDNALGAGLRTRDVHLSSASIFNTAPGDIVVAQVDAGPVIVARPSNPKTIAIGIPLAAIRYDLATPLLFANVLRWMAPETFLEKQLETQPVGTVNAAIAAGTDPATVRVLRPDGTAVPFTLEGGSLHFFSGTPGTVRVMTGDRERVYSLSLPEVADSQWNVPSEVQKGLPQFRGTATSYDIWQFLAVAAGVLLLYEWIGWGRSARRALKPWRLKKAA